MTSQAMSNSFGSDDQSFANDIFSKYQHQLLQLANDRLDQQLSGKVSPEDVVQSVLKSFFRRADLIGVSQLNHDVIWGLLSIITVRKCKKWTTFYHCGKRDIERESISTSDSSFDNFQQQPAPAPQAEDAIIATELIDHLLRNFTQRQQDMILMRIQGLSNEQIALQCKSSLRTVARTLTRAKSILAGLVLDD